MNNIGLKDFWRQTYKTGSPVPLVISIQVCLIVLIYFLDLLFELKIVPQSFLEPTVRLLSLPSNFSSFIAQPWSLVTSNFVYVKLWTILFDSLWLYWVGQIFFTFLNKRQFLFVYIASWLLGSVLYMGFGSLIPMPSNLQLMGGSLPLAAVLAAIVTLVPKYELRFLLIGTVKLKLVAIIYFGLEFLTLTMTNRPAAISYFAVILFGMGFTYALKSGMDWSTIFQKKQQKPAKMKVVVGNNIPTNRKHRYDLPNQDEIDAILDKISVSGYDSLTNHEKETLFRASNSGDKVDG
ncbi:MAG TPA: peptidase S54 [Sphingobacterium sp.]|nr:peptidase S54 [Sphingobacterium sp.]